MNLVKKNDFYLFKSFLFLGFVSFIACIIFSTTLWKDLYYTSDGFHVFSFLRNINNGQGLIEGVLSKATFAISKCDSKSI